VLVQDDRIMHVGGGIRAPAAQPIDLQGKTLMPGLLDCHVHVTAATADVAQIIDSSPT
jgi:imidazolonepropionase-like amidohydrolase